MIVSLDGDESVVEIQRLLLAAPRTRFIFLAHDYSVTPNLASFVSDRRCLTVLSQQEPTLIVVATIIALLAEESLNVV